MAIPTDFPGAPAPEPPWSPGVWVGGTLFATFALGFTEGCLEIERRPIPLRFALRFAVANMLPSAVWRSISARHVAAASGVPSSALINDAELTGSRSIAVGKRLVLVKSVRALRLAVGSYGLMWSLWRSYEANSSDRNKTTEEVVKYGESVVRLAPVNSPLSRASRRKHGDHIVTVPVATESWKEREMNRVMDDVDWKSVGVQVQVEGEIERVKVMEVELRDAATNVTYAGKLKAKASKEGGTSVCSVAVLPISGPPILTSVADSFDVCFNPLSAVLTFIASVCHQRGAARVFLVGNKDDEKVDAEDGNVKESLTSLLAIGLLYRHGITTSILKMQDKELTTKKVEESSSEDVTEDSNDGVVFFISESLSAGHSAAREMREQGLIAQQHVCFIVEESLSGQSIAGEELQAQSEVLRIATSVDIEEHNVTEKQKAEVDEQELMATYMSIADVTDQTLQGIRQLVRKGKKPDVIQATVYQAYGTQRVVAPTRLDQFSNMHV